jgi:hypothetical protein
LGAGMGSLNASAMRSLIWPCNTMHVRFDDERLKKVHICVGNYFEHIPFYAVHAGLQTFVCVLW